VNEGWRFALSRRWLGYLALVVAFAVACVFLSMWQFARRAEAREAIERVEQNWHAAPVPVDEVLADPTSFDPDDTWRSVELRGEYLLDEQLLVRGRPFQGRAGFEVLVPFRTDDGTVIVVDRGWIPVGRSQDSPDAVPAAPEGEVALVVRLKPGEPVIPGRTAPDGQVATIHLPTIAETVGDDVVTGAYGLLAEEEPSVSPRPEPYPEPVPDEGAHLSYAFQWVAFGVLAFIGLGWAIRREYRLRNEDAPDVRARAEARARRAAARAPSDDEVEDAMLDRAAR
jgi:cytochrome oxidase assembly protein ShyY1